MSVKGDVGQREEVEKQLTQDVIGQGEAKEVHVTVVQVESVLIPGHLKIHCE